MSRPEKSLPLMSVIVDEAVLNSSGIRCPRCIVSVPSSILMPGKLIKRCCPQSGTEWCPKRVEKPAILSSLTVPYGSESHALSEGIWPFPRRCAIILDCCGISFTTTMNHYLFGSTDSGIFKGKTLSSDAFTNGELNDLVWIIFMISPIVVGRVEGRNIVKGCCYLT